MAIRWRMLALLFLVRVAMAFQFQAVGALAPLYADAFRVGLADVGLLIGLYLSPGLVLAVPGGALGRRFGDKNVVAAGLAMMTIGSAMMAASDLWAAQLVGRTLAGVGGVLLNVLMSKMAVDWFAGREAGFALALFVNSWPVGIALALMVLPTLAEPAGLVVAQTVVAGATATGFFALLRFYRAPPDAAVEASDDRDRLRGALLGAVVAAGAIWGLYNTALGIVFSFGPELFVRRGLDLVEAGSLTSIVLWMLAVMGAVGGFLSDRTGRRDLVLTAGNIGFAAAAAFTAWSEHVLPGVLAMGVFSGLGIGAMMSLPASVLTPGTRAIGMGLFFAVFYVCTSIGPMLGGWIADVTGDAASAFLLASALLVASVLVLPIHLALADRSRETAA